MNLPRLLSSCCDWSFNNIFLCITYKIFLRIILRWKIAQLRNYMWQSSVFQSNSYFSVILWGREFKSIAINQMNLLVVVVVDDVVLWKALKFGNIACLIRKKKSLRYLSNQCFSCSLFLSFPSHAAMMMMIKLENKNFHTNTYAMLLDAVCVLPMLHSPFLLRIQHSIEKNKTVKSSPHTHSVIENLSQSIPDRCIVRMLKTETEARAFLKLQQQPQKQKWKRERTKEEWRNINKINLGL